MSLPVNRAARDVLLDLKTNNRLTPETVLNVAKASDSPLHRYFEWNESKAARKYNLQIAQSMVRTIRVERVVTDHGVVRNISVPVYISDPKNRRTFRTLDSVVGTTRARDVFDDLIGEIASAAGHLQRALAISLALGFADEIRIAISRVTRLKAKVEAARKKKAARKEKAA